MVTWHDAAQRKKKSILRLTDRISLLEGFLKVVQRWVVFIFRMFPFLWILWAWITRGGNQPDTLFRFWGGGQTMTIHKRPPDQPRDSTNAPRHLPKLLGQCMGEMIRSWMCLVLFVSLEIFTRHPRFCFELWCIRKHPSVIIIYAQSWNPWLLTPSPTHLGKKKRQQDRVLCMTVVDFGWGWCWKESCARVCDVEIFWTLQMNWCFHMFPVYKLKRLQKGRGTSLTSSIGRPQAKEGGGAEEQREARLVKKLMPI